jgi:hypothetical protein
MIQSLYKRRTMMLQMKHRGTFFTDEIVEELAKKFSVSPATVMSDWSRREEWMPKIMQVSRGQEALREIFHEFKCAREAFWKVHDVAMNRGDKKNAVAALRGVTDCLKKEAHFKSELGYSNDVGTKPLFSNQEEVVQNMVDVMVAAVEEADPTMLPKLLPVFEKLRKQFNEEKRQISKVEVLDKQT